MYTFMTITKALADENRVRILMALSGRDELCVCQLIEMLQLAPSTVSKHLFLLRNARLIRGRKHGRWMYYRLNADQAPQAVTEALDWVKRSVADASIVARDRERLDFGGSCPDGRRRLTGSGGEIGKLTTSPRQDEDDDADAGRHLPLQGKHPEVPA